MSSLSIRANAGTGKTTTLCWVEQGVPMQFKPSDQQKAILDFLKIPKAKRKKLKVRFSCFNKKIQLELEYRLPTVECVTNNALGSRTLAKYMGRGFRPDGRKYDYIAKEIIGDPWKDKELWPVIKTAKALCDLVRNSLVGHADRGKWFVTEEELMDAADEYSIDIEKPEAIPFVQLMIDAGIDALKKGRIDFNDQLFLCHVLGAKPEKVYRGYIDEAQDLNKAQRELILPSAEEIIVVGDVNQSMYLFAGAAPDSIPAMEAYLGCETLPLSVTRRCPKSHVAYAKQFLPEDTLFQAHDTNIDGVIEHRVVTIEDYGNIASKGIDNLVISRTNAPLVRECFRCYRHRIPAEIMGRKFGEMIISQLKKHLKDTPEDALSAISAQIDKKRDRYIKAEKTDLVEACDDEEIVYQIFLGESSSVQEAIDAINLMFPDKDEDNITNKNCVHFCTAHKSKGLEADYVIILTPELLPHPKLSQISIAYGQQERNIAYVAHTRSKNVMICHQREK